MGLMREKPSHARAERDLAVGENRSMKKVIIWGTGHRALEVMRDFPHESLELIGFVDSDPERQKQPFLDHPVIPPSRLPGMNFDMLMIASCYHKEILESARALGVDEDKLSLSPNYFHFLKYSDKLTPGQIETLSCVPWWYHAFEILPGVTTPGICPYKPELLDYPECQDLTGKRVLDIGAWDGPYTLEMTRRGANVTGFDLQPPMNSGFNTTCQVNAISNGHICANVYDLCSERHGSYDMVTFFGVYYHLKNPLAAFANINRVLPKGGLMAVEGALLEGAPVVDSYWKEKAQTLASIKDIPLAYYVENTFEGEWSNWWVPNIPCLRQWITSSGFEILHFETLGLDVRAVCLARKVRDLKDEHRVL